MLLPLIPLKHKNKLPQDVFRVAAYCRVSTLYEEQRTSIEAQISYYRQMILNREDWRLVDIYVDRASGRNAQKRKELQRLMEDCRCNRIDLIIMNASIMKGQFY